MLAVADFIKQRFLSVVRCECGVAFIEFAACLPVLLLLFYGVVELSRLELISQKLDHTAIELTQIVSQLGPNAVAATSTTSAVTQISKTALSNIMSTVPGTMNPYTVSSMSNAGGQTTLEWGANIRVIITDISADASGTATINWQSCIGNFAATSNVGNYNSGNSSFSSNPTLPNSFRLNPHEEVIVGEILYQFQPILKNLLPSGWVLSKKAVYKPANGPLDTTASVNGSHC